MSDLSPLDDGCEAEHPSVPGVDDGRIRIKLMGLLRFEVPTTWFWTG